MTETKPIEVWVAVDARGDVRIRTIKYEPYVAKTAASVIHGGGADWEDLEKDGWTIAPYTLTHGHKEK
jgi:hypothetical protein